MTGRAARPRRGVNASTAWDPLRDLMLHKERLNRLLEAVLRRGDDSPVAYSGWRPPVDVREEKDSFVLTSEVPGVRPSDLSVRVDGGIVTIEGRRPLEKEARSALRIERPYGSFARAVHLPAPVDPSGVSARVRDGVLQVLLPRSPGGRSRSIKVPVRS